MNCDAVLPNRRVVLRALGLRGHRCCSGKAPQAAELFCLSGLLQQIAKGQQFKVQPQKKDTIVLVFLHLQFTLFQLRGV